MSGPRDQPRRRRGFGQRVFYSVCRTIAFWTLVIFFRYRRFGLEHVPREGGALLVANHQSYLDPPVVGLCVRNRQFYPLARVGLFKNRVLRAIISGLNAIPIDQERADSGAVRQAIARLDEGEVVCIFPEGARSPDGRIKGFKRGAAVILNRSRCPVVPVALDGAFTAWPRDSRFPKRFFTRVAVEVGAPLTHDELLKDGPDAAVRRIESEVRALHARLRERLGRPPLEENGADADASDA